MTRANRTTHPFSTDLETLETRRLFCRLHDGGADDVGELSPTSPAVTDALAKSNPTGKVIDHTKSWYKPAKKVTILTGNVVKATSTAVPVKQAGTRAITAAAESVSFAVNAAGLPLLTSRADGKGLKIFLDFDGYGTDIPFDMDGNTASFNAKEQTVIYNAWRDIVSYYAMMDVNVTTVQPATGGSNPAFVWQRITDSVSGGAAYVGWIDNANSRGWTDDGNAISRTSGIAHEIGHQLNLQHQSDYANDGTKTNEYTNGYAAHGSVIGVDYAQSVHKWYFGRNAVSADTLQNDLTTMASYLKSKYPASADGFMPDDYTGTTFASAAVLSASSGASAATGTIERYNDADLFNFTSAGGLYDLSLIPGYRSALAPKFELYDASGNLIAAKDDTSYRATADNTGEELTLSLPAGTYYAKVLGHGDYGDVGEYAFTATPLPGNFASRDVLGTTNGMGQAGSVSYDGSTGTFTQTAGAAGMGGTVDAVRFTYVTLTGDGSVTAKVNTLTSDTVTTAPRAGLALRETLAGSARNAAIEFSPTNTVYGYRTAAGYGTTTGTTTLPVGNWLRVTRSGNNVALAQSTDGVTFTTVYTATLSGLASQVYVGLTTASRDALHPTTATFTNVVTTGNTATAAPTDNGLPAPAGLTAAAVATQSTGMTLNWTDVTGETGFAIERSVDGINWTKIATTAANVTTYTDTPAFGSMRWWYRVAALTAATPGQSAYSPVVSVVNKPAAPTNPQAIPIGTNKLSLTWRDVSGDTGYRVEQSINGGATYTTVTTTAANISGYNVTGLVAGTAYAYRITPTSAVGDGVPLLINTGTPQPAVTTLALTNKTVGSVTLTWTDLATETGYRVQRSTDNATWADIGTVAANVTTYTDASALSPLTHYYYRVFGTSTYGQGATGNTAFFATPNTTASTSPWKNVDIGSVGGSGAAYTDGTTATVIGGGGNTATGPTDTQQFLYRTLTGDGEIVARVSGIEAINDLTKGGVMFRESLDANAKFAAIYYQAASTQGTDMAYRTTVGGNGVAVQGPTDAAASYLRLVRSGSTFTAYTSTTGATGPWTQLGTANIAMNATLYVGLVATARDNAYLAKASFTDASVTPAALPAVSSIVVNDGSAQRSRITSMTVSFSTPVNLASDAITLWQRTTAADTPTPVSGFVLTASADGKSYTLTFPAGTFPTRSLSDGLYDLRVAAPGVKNADGFAMTADASLATYRLFGDINGDRTVNFSDFLQLQGNFLTTSASPTFASGLDANDDGTINFSDFLQLQGNFLKSL